MFFAVLLSWVAAGVIVGFVASKAVNLRGDDPKLGIFAAVGGAVAAGIIYSMASGTSMTTWTLWAQATALIGGLVGVVLWHAIRSRTITHERYTARAGRVR
jgi:uncharacterized membrane protein YeaQ/YmgE (transglycosylase-associated protein family)